MEHSLNFVILLDIYGELLSNSQRESLDMRYNADFSLSEIAEQMGGITRQSVADYIRKGEQKLIELEEKLGFAKRLRELSGVLDHAQGIVRELNQENSDKRLDELEIILNKVREEL